MKETRTEGKRGEERPIFFLPTPEGKSGQTLAEELALVLLKREFSGENGL
jgi:hypothetical protein